MKQSRVRFLRIFLDFLFYNQFQECFCQCLNKQFYLFSAYLESILANFMPFQDFLLGANHTPDRGSAYIFRPCCICRDCLGGKGEFPEIYAVLIESKTWSQYYFKHRHKSTQYLMLEWDHYTNIYRQCPHIRQSNKQGSYYFTM